MEPCQILEVEDMEEDTAEDISEDTVVDTSEDTVVDTSEVTVVDTSEVTAEDTSEVTIMLEDMVMETLDWDMVMVEDIMSRKS